MIQAVGIRGLRGIREGELRDLTPLVILVGPNGCGKSTVLEALFIGASNTPGDAIGKCVQRRSGVWNGARWLFARQATGPTDWHIRVQSLGDGERTTALLVPGGNMILALAATGGQVTGVQLQFEPDNRWVCQQDAVSQMPALREKSRTNAGTWAQECRRMSAGMPRPRAPLGGTRSAIAQMPRPIPSKAYTDE